MESIAVEEPQANKPTPGTRRAGVAKVVAAAAILVVLFLMREDLARFIPEFATWVESLGIWGPVVFAAGYAIATVAMVPGSLLTLGAGAIFGLATGFVTVSVGASVGATLAFLVSRYVARSWVEQRLEDHEQFAAVDRAIGDEGLKIVVLLRLSPLFPFNLLNYALGLTDVRLRDYILAHLAMLPGTLLYVYYGRLAGVVAEVASGAGAQRDTGYYFLFGLGLIATITVTIIVTRIAIRSLRGVTDER